LGALILVAGCATPSHTAAEFATMSCSKLESIDRERVQLLDTFESWRSDPEVDQFANNLAIRESKQQRVLIADAKSKKGCR
jgi:hypothetical protein